MIERYTLPEMGDIWSEQNKFENWLEFEIVVCEALAELGEIPADAVKRIREKAAFTIERINEIEETTDHDVIAFLTNVAEYIGNDSRYVHLGLTSSDLLDTTLSMQLRQAGGILLARLDELREAVKKRALEHKHTIMMGRTHGVHDHPANRAEVDRGERRDEQQRTQPELAAPAFCPQRRPGKPDQGQRRGEHRAGEQGQERPHEGDASRRAEYPRDAGQIRRR